MKKIVIFLICSMFLYGAGLQVATPKVDLKKFKNAKELQFVETKPAQFTLKIPIDIDPIPENFQLNSTNGELYNIKEQYLRCYLLNGKSNYAFTNQHINISKGGKKTIIMKFNGIPTADMLKIDRYYCAIQYGRKGEAAILRTHGFVEYEIEKYSAYGVVK